MILFWIIVFSSWIQPGSAMDQKRVNQGLRNRFDSLRQNQIQTQMSYKHLIHEEPFTIETLNSKKYPYSKIAEIIGRFHSTVWRELKRNTHANCSYSSELATKMRNLRSL
jgi:hypothetical protein